MFATLQLSGTTDRNIRAWVARLVSLHIQLSVGDILEGGRDNVMTSCRSDTITLVPPSLPNQGKNTRHLNTFTSPHFPPWAIPPWPWRGKAGRKGMFKCFSFPSSPLPWWSGSRRETKAFKYACSPPFTAPTWGLPLWAQLCEAHTSNFSECCHC